MLSTDISDQSTHRGHLLLLFSPLLNTILLELEIVSLHFFSTSLVIHDMVRLIDSNKLIVSRYERAIHPRPLSLHVLHMCVLYVRIFAYPCVILELLHLFVTVSALVEFILFFLFFLAYMALDLFLVALAQGQLFLTIFDITFSAINETT